MLKTIAISNSQEILFDLPLDKLKESHIKWFWVDFDTPTKEEKQYLKTFFDFHDLSIEDCLEDTQRPKIDFYDDYFFLVTHVIDQKSLETQEVDIFYHSNFIVTFHLETCSEIKRAMSRLEKRQRLQENPIHMIHHIIDCLVDSYFTPIYQIEDRLNRIEIEIDPQRTQRMMKEIFSIRNDLSHLRKSVIPMRDLLYRILNSNRLNHSDEHKNYFRDIYDHLLKLTEMVETNREFTSDIRDNYLSVNADHMNNIMKRLTLITSIFMPLTFIAGIYGMNFEYMPELHTKYGYFITIGVMGVISIAMYIGFKLKRWF